MLWYIMLQEKYDFICCSVPSSVRRTESDEISGSPALVKAGRIIEGITISLGTYCLEQISKQSRLAGFGAGILPRAAILC